MSVHICAVGEQGKVDESMREMAAIEALKSEKADKEVSKFHLISSRVLKFRITCAHSANFNN
jgi:hypothetical protein